jgi:hypothetical protein
MERVEAFAEITTKGIYGYSLLKEKGEKIDIKHA